MTVRWGEYILDSDVFGVTTESAINDESFSLHDLVSSQFLNLAENHRGISGQSSDVTGSNACHVNFTLGADNPEPTHSIQVKLLYLQHQGTECQEKKNGKAFREDMKRLDS